MNILIFGANGLLGRYLVEKLIKENHNIFSVVRDKSKLNFNNKNLNVIEMDLSNIDESILPKNKIDVIYFLAQSNRFREFPEGSVDMLKINVLAPISVANWALKNNHVESFIYASSGGVYTNLNEPVKEFFEINANEKLGFYLDSKLSAEMLLKNYANNFETFAIIRPFFMYGLGQNETMLIPRLITSVQNGKEITLNGENGLKINPIYITDAAQAISNILDLKGEHIINIAGNEVVSLRELCIQIGEVVDKEPIFKVNHVSQNDLVADIRIMKEKLYTPSITLEEGILKMVSKK